MENQKSVLGVKTGVLLIIAGIALFIIGLDGFEGAGFAGFFLFIVGIIWAIYHKVKKSKN